MVLKEEITSNSNIAEELGSASRTFLGTLVCLSFRFWGCSWLQISESHTLKDYKEKLPKHQENQRNRHNEQ